ncbi:hypothetical protein DKP78_03520 [Enterococcus faecium]|nr:hypothetical protein DKP78_03520 [Enterococcus faecium]
MKFIHNFTFSNYFNFNLIIHDTSVSSHFFAEEKIVVIMQEKNEEVAIYSNEKFDKTNQTQITINGRFCSLIV